jgi:peptide/nickel transport system substrate-binding protein
VLLSRKGKGMNRLVRSIWIVLVLALALLAAGCGGDGGDGNGNGEAEETEAPSRAVIAQGVDPTTMDPHAHRETPTANVLRHLYDPLIERDGEDPTTFNPILAESFEQVDDTTIEFRLRTGVEFSDGTPFNAETVEYNFRRLMGQIEGQEPPVLAFEFESLDRVEAVDETTVRFVTKQPDSLILGTIAEAMMIPQGSVDESADALASEPVGTGAYTLVRWSRNNEVVMTANADYFLGAPAIEEVVFRTMPEASSRLAAIQTGDVDVITNVPPDNIPEVESAGNARVVTVPSARVASVWLDTLDSEPLTSPQVRQALNYAIDIEAITEEVMSGFGTPVATIVPEYFAGHNPDLEPYPYDPDRARELLAEAGYENGFPLELMVPRGRYLLGEEVTQAVVGNLREVGIDATIQAVEFGVFATATQERDIPDGFFAAWGNAFFDPLDELQVAVLTGTMGFSWYSNEEVDRLIAEAVRTTDPEEHADVLRRIEEIIYDDPPFIFLFAYQDSYGVANRLPWEPRSDELIYMYEVS